MGVHIEHGEVDLLADDVTTKPWSLARQVSKTCLAAKLEQSRHEYVLEEGSPEAVSNILVVGFNLILPIACSLFCESVIHFYIYFQSILELTCNRRRALLHSNLGRGQEEAGCSRCQASG